MVRMVHTEGRHLRHPSLDLTSPDGTTDTVELRGTRVTVGRVSPTSRPDVALAPDPQHWVSRVHCVLELRSGMWSVSDNATVNGTLLCRRGTTDRIDGDVRLQHGDAILVLGDIDGRGRPRYWRLVFVDPHTTLPADVPVLPAATTDGEPCVECDWTGARIFRRLDGDRTEVVGLRPKAHQLLCYMASRSERVSGAPVVCSYDELITALWGERADWPAHRSFTREDVRDVVSDARAVLEPDTAKPRLLQTVRGMGYRLAAWVDGAA